MNGLEASYAAYLEALQYAGKILAWKYEPLKLRLADKTFYTPDFLVIAANGQIELHETKGYWEEDARVKVKIAAEQHPWFILVAVQEQKDGRGWIVERFGMAKKSMTDIHTTLAVSVTKGARRGKADR